MYANTHILVFISRLSTLFMLFIFVDFCSLGSIHCNVTASMARRPQNDHKKKIAYLFVIIITIEINININISNNCICLLYL